MRNLILSSLLFIGILSNTDVSPKCVEMAKAYVEYVNNLKEK